MSLSFLLFMASLEQSRSRVLEVWLAKPTLLFIIAFCLKKTEKLSSRAIAVSKGAVFAKNMLIFVKIITSVKLRRSWYYKLYFLQLNKCVCLHTRFQISSVILTSFRQVISFPSFPPTNQQTPKRLIQIRVNIWQTFVFNCFHFCSQYYMYVLYVYIYT